MKRTTVIGILGIGLIIGSVLFAGFRYSYGSSPENFLLGAGMIYCILGFGISKTHEEYAMPLWGISVITALLVLASVAVLSNPASILQALTDKIPFCLGVGAVGTGIVAGVRHQAGKSNLITLLLGVGLLLLSSITVAMTIPSLTFYFLLQSLLVGGAILTMIPAYIILRTGTEGTSG